MQSLPMSKSACTTQPASKAVAFDVRIDDITLTPNDVLTSGAGALMPI